MTKIFFFVNNLYKKEVIIIEDNKKIGGIIAQLNDVKGQTIRLRVNRGRNKFVFLEGRVENVYPAIFTLRSEGGEVFSFSYSDVVAKNILFSK